VTRILDIPNYEPGKVKASCVITLHQYMTYFQDEGGLFNVESVAAESKYT
jgi:hypothetical protein